MLASSMKVIGAAHATKASAETALKAEKSRLLGSFHRKWAMEEEGYLWCISRTSYYNGDRLRSRPSHCIQCDTSRIGYVKRHHDAAYIYVAGSLASKVVKVGSAIWPERRVGALNTRYCGGISDWVMLYDVKFESAGQDRD